MEEWDKMPRRLWHSLRRWRCPRAPITWGEIHDFPYLLYFEYKNWEWPDHWNMNLSDEEEDLRKQRIAAFNKFEKFLWLCAVPYRSSIFLGFFLTFV